MTTLITIKSLVYAALLNVNVTSNIPMNEVRCLTQAVIQEAQSESKEGRIAVAHTIINRTRSENFPSTICGVIKQKSQFSYYPSRKESLTVNNEKDLQSYSESAMLAVLVFTGKIKDNTRGALYYINPKTATNVAWTYKLRKIKKIGNHQFYGMV